MNIPLYKAEETVKETYTDEELEILLKRPNVRQSSCGILSVFFCGAPFATRLLSVVMRPDCKLITIILVYNPGVLWYTLPEVRQLDRKDALLRLLENRDGFMSGSDLAREMGISRAAVWKLVQLLKEEGHAVEAVTNRGYRLAEDSDAVTAAGVERYLGDLAGKIPVEVIDECGSTNLEMKARTSELPAWHTLIARRQTGGRGRMGRSFYSPDGSGLYMSVLLRPKLAAADASLITTAAAVAVCRATEMLGSERAEIKWVNDVLIRGKKICGILTEAGFDMESGNMEYAVLGVGINVTEPAGGFPAEIANVAGAVFPRRERDLRDRLSAAFLGQFYEIYTALPARTFVEEYQARSCLVGKPVDVLRGGEARRAMVLAVDDRCRLLVRYEDGTEEALFSGEVSVRPEAPL